MEPKNLVAALCVLAALACFADTVHAGGENGLRDRRPDVTSAGARYDRGGAVQMTCRFRTKALSLDCSPSYCVLVLSTVREA